MTKTLPGFTRHQTLQGLDDLLMALESARDEDALALDACEGEEEEAR